MPSRSAKQQRMMNAVAHNPAFAKKVGIPTSVGQDFVAADKKAGKKFAGGGGIPRVEDALRRSGVGDPEPAPAPPPAPDNSKFFKPVDRNAKGREALLAKRAAEDARERKARGYAKGGSIDGCATRGKTKVRYT